MEDRYTETRGPEHNQVVECVPGQSAIDGWIAVKVGSLTKYLPLKKDGKILFERVQSSPQCLLLHAAIIQRAPAAVIRALLRAYPEACGILMPDGNLPIHYVIAEATFDVATVRMVLEAAPAGAELPNSAGVSALQLTMAESSTAQAMP